MIEASATSSSRSLPEHRTVPTPAAVALVLLGLSPNPVAGPAPAGGQEVRVGENVRVSAPNPGRAHYEVRAAAHPTDPGVMMAAGMAWSDSTGTYDVIAYRSPDGGESWTQTLEVDRRRNVQDPDFAFGPDGWVYMTEFGAGVQRLQRSPDGGATWVEPVDVHVGDRPFVSVAGPGAPNAGRVYLHGSDRSDPADGGRGLKAVGVARADEHASDLLPGAKLHVDGDRYVLGNGESAVLSDGTLVLLYPERLDRSDIGRYEAATGADPARTRSPNGRLRALVSRDGGASFEQARTVGDWYHRFGRGRSATIPALAADTSVGPFRDRLYAAWTDFRSGQGQILLAHSEDGGRSWSEPIVVNRGGGPAFHPTLAVNDEGVLGVAWYDRRDSPTGLGWSVRFAASRDGGETMGSSVEVSEEPFRRNWDGGLVAMGRGGGGERLRADVSLHSFSDIGGHTAGLAVDAGGTFHPVWVDNRTDVPQMWTAPVEVEGEAVRHGDPALSELRDVSSSTALRVTRSGYRGAPGVVTLEVRLRNTSEDTIRGPVVLRVVDLWSEFGDARLAEPRDGKTGPGAVIPVTEALPDGTLGPGESSRPVEIRARVDSASGLGPKPPPTPGRRSGAGYGILNLDLRALGRVDPSAASGS